MYVIKRKNIIRCINKVELFGTMVRKTNMVYILSVGTQHVIDQIIDKYYALDFRDLYKELNEA